MLIIHILNSPAGPSYKTKHGLHTHRNSFTMSFLHRKKRIRQKFLTLIFIYCLLINCPFGGYNSDYFSGPSIRIFINYVIDVP